METTAFQEHLRKLDDEGIRNAFREYSQLGSISGYHEIHLIYMADIIEEANRRVLNVLLNKSSDYGY